MYQSATAAPAAAAPRKHGFLVSWLTAPAFVFKGLPFLQPLVRLLGAFVGSLGLILLPVPVGPMRKKLVGRILPNGNLVFYSHPRLLACMHLVWVGWLVALLNGLNVLLADSGTEFRVPVGCATWLWLTVLLLTIIALGLDLGRVAMGFVLLGLLVMALSTLLLQLLMRLPLLGWLASAIASVPVSIDWGVPAVTSLVLGTTIALIASWRRLNDVWTVSCQSNFLEHYTFEARDNSIPQGAKSFSAAWPCLLKKYLFCGWGEIKVDNNLNQQDQYVIPGVLFAHWHEKVLMRRVAEVKVDAVGHPAHGSLEEATAAAQEDFS